LHTFPKNLGSLQNSGGNFVTYNYSMCYELESRALLLGNALYFIIFTCHVIYAELVVVVNLDSLVDPKASTFYQELE
jgi:hypothetical protein